VRGEKNKASQKTMWSVFKAKKVENKLKIENRQTTNSHDDRGLANNIFYVADIFVQAMVTQYRM